MRSREEELAVAQLARERMSTIFSVEEVQLMAERQRKRGSYQLELESACSPLLPVAWLGLVEERLDWWKQKHTLSKKRSQRRQPADQGPDCHTAATAGSGGQLISTAQLLAAEEVVQVVLYRSRRPLDLTSLQHCPNLRTLSLSKCGLEVLAGLPSQHCPLLMELSAQV